MKNWIVGIDLGGTSVKLGLVDREGKIVASGALSTGVHADAHSLIRAIVEKLEEMIPGGFTSPEIKGVGLGAPNANCYTGVIAFAPNLPFAADREVPFGAIFEELSGFKPAMTNDANAAAIGEKLFGSAKELDDFMVVTLGTGLGSGIYSGGKVLYGYDGLAGEMGHTVFMRNGRKCNCGKRGCIETYVSAGGLMATYRELQSDAPSVSDPAEIYKRAIEGCEIALRTFHLTGEYLGAHLADMATLFSPDAIFISGGLAQSGDLLMEPAKKSFEDNLMQHHKGKIKIGFSGLKGQQTAILGAAALGWNAIGINRQ